MIKLSQNILVFFSRRIIYIASCHLSLTCIIWNNNRFLKYNISREKEMFRFKLKVIGSIKLFSVHKVASNPWMSKIINV